MDSGWLISYVFLWIIVLLLVVAGLVHSRMIGLLHYRFGPAGAKSLADGPAVGSRLTTLSGVYPTASKWDLTFPAASDLILIFVSPQCSTCSEVLPHIADFSKAQTSIKTFLVSIIDDIRMNQAYIAYRDLEKMNYIISEKMADDLNIEGVPYALYVNHQGIVTAKGLVNNYENLVGLNKSAAKFNFKGELH